MNLALHFTYYQLRFHWENMEGGMKVEQSYDEQLR